MSEIFSGVGVFILIALTIINLVIYHTIFSVTYFGSLGRHFIREVITAWIVAVLEMALIGTILVKVFGVVSAVLTFLLKIIVIVLVIISVVYTCKTLKKAYHYKEEGIVSENKAARVLKRIWNTLDYLTSLETKEEALFALSGLGTVLGVCILGSFISGIMKGTATTQSDYAPYVADELESDDIDSSNEIIPNKIWKVSSENDNSAEQKSTAGTVLNKQEEVPQYTINEWNNTWIREEGPLTTLGIRDASMSGGFQFSINVGDPDGTAFVDVSDCHATWGETGQSANGAIEYVPVTFTMDGNELIVEEKEPVTERIPLSGRYVREEDAINYPCEYVFAESDTALIGQTDLENKTALECRIAKNEIYARHGRKFNDEFLQNYFNTCSWYDGEIEPGDFDEQVLNNIELENLKILSDYQDSLGDW